MLISLAQCSQRPIDIIEELAAISSDGAKNGLLFDSGKGKKRNRAPIFVFHFRELGPVHTPRTRWRRGAAYVKRPSRTVNGTRIQNWVPNRVIGVHN